MSTVAIEESLFPVREEPAVFQEDPSGYMNTGYKFIVREDTGQVLSCMTDEYKLVNNQEVVDKTEKVLNKTKAQLKEVKMFGDGARTKYTYIFPNTKVKVATNDYVNPEIIISNSYDGSNAVGVMGGAFRLVCENGLVIGYMLGRTKNDHSIYNNSLDKIEEFIEEDIPEKYKGLEIIQVDPLRPLSIIKKETHHGKKGVDKIFSEYEDANIAIIRAPRETDWMISVMKYLNDCDQSFPDSVQQAFMSQSSKNDFLLGKTGPSSKRLN